MSDPTIPDEVRHATSGARRILTPTHESASEGEVQALAVAIELAAASGATLHISDRSHTTWGDTAHIERGDIERVRQAGAMGAHMVQKMELALAAGVPDVVALKPSMPDLEGFYSALNESAADVLVVADRPEHVGWILKHELGKEPLRTLRQRAGDSVTFVVVADGTARLEA